MQVVYVRGFTMRQPYCLLKSHASCERSDSEPRSAACADAQQTNRKLMKDVLIDTNCDKQGGMGLVAGLEDF